IIVCADHPQALELVQGVCPQEAARRRFPQVVTFGFAPEAQVNAADWPDIPVLGRHNVANALAAIAVALSRGFTREQIAAALPDAVSALPDRRFEQVADSDGVRVFTDYAHHPAELKCAIDMARALHPTRLRVLFQPHRYSRTKALCDEFPPAFKSANEVVLAPVYPAFEAPLLGGDIADLYAAFRGQPPQVILARSLDEGWRHLFLTARPGDILMLLGAGDIINLVPRVKKEMAGWKFTDCAWTPLAPHSFFRTGGQTCGGGEKVIVGMGSNTWFSDCATDIDIVHVPSDRPAARTGASLLADHPELAFMAGIPGTVGGWTKMNAGAFGDSFGNHVESVEVVLADGSVRTIPAADCGFAYRRSTIPGLITSVTLKPAPVGDVAARPADFLARRKSFPPRTCGSVFKNPPNAPAGKLLEEAECKSLRVGGAYVWQEHANVIVAGDGCTSSDILALARLMAARVRARFGITLKPEIRGLVTGDGESATTKRPPRPQTPGTSRTT
ncbi:MAG: FAD-binding protein, partial [Kiritimatiellae bacterium]|nr:FAD-binding protein [Kiritimatiellia bacterium]